jgi:hypothetical protein
MSAPARRGPCAERRGAADSDSARRNAAVALTRAQTAHLVGVDVRGTLTSALERVASCREGGRLCAELTPWADTEPNAREAERAGGATRRSGVVDSRSS